ncbi:hypothetical protein [Streptomyces sp. TE4109]
MIDFHHLLSQVRAVITELDPHLPCTLLPVGEAVEHPERFTGGILVIHTDLLRAPGREALLARAGTADSLIVAARADVDDSVLNTLPGTRSARFVLSAREPMQRPGRLDAMPGIDMRFEAVSGNTNADPFAEAKDRFIRQLKQGAPATNNPVDPKEFTGIVSFEERLEAVRTADPDEIRRDSQRAADSPVSGKAAPYSSRQEQSEAALRPDAIDSGLLERHAAQPDHLHEHRIDAGTDRTSPRLYSMTTRYTDQFLAGEEGPNLLCDDPIAALHFALTASTNSPLAVSCSTTTDGRTWTRMPLRDLHADADRALQQTVKPPMYPGYPDSSSPRPLDALRQLVEHAQADWLDAALRRPVDEASTWIPDEPTDNDWIRAGQLWAAVWGGVPAEPVLEQLTARFPNPPYTQGKESLRDQASAVMEAVDLAHASAVGDNFVQLHTAWLLLHELDTMTVTPQYEPGTDLDTPRRLLLERIAARHPDTAVTLAAARDQPNAPAMQAAAHAYLDRILPLWPRIAAWTEQARSDYTQEVDGLRSSEPRRPSGPPETEAQTVLRTALAPLAEPAALPHHAAAALWRSHSGRATEQAGWDMATLSARINDLALAHAAGGNARTQAEQNLTAVSNFHNEHVHTHAARGHLRSLAASLVSLDKAYRTLMDGIWSIAQDRRDQHDSAERPWNGYDEQQATADLKPVVQTGETRLEHLRQRHFELTQHALTDLLPQLRDIPPTSHRASTMRNHIAPLDLLRRDLNELARLADACRRDCDEIRTRLDKGPGFGKAFATDHDLAVAERRLQTVQRRYADTQTEFALSVAVGRTFDQLRTPPPSEHADVTKHAGGMESGLHRSRRAGATGHSQAAMTALRAAANQDFDRWAQPFVPTYVPPPTEQRDGRVARQGAAESPSLDMWARAFEHKRSLIDQMNRRVADGPAPDSAEYIDLAELDAVPHADIDFDRLAAEEKERIAAAVDAAEQRAAELCDRLREGAQDRAAASRQPHAPHQHDQAQSAAHQHNIPGGRAPGQ